LIHLVVLLLIVLPVVSSSGMLSVHDEGLATIPWHSKSMGNGCLTAHQIPALLLGMVAFHHTRFAR
jgi:hypothetical protein